MQISNKKVNHIKAFSTIQTYTKFLYEDSFRDSSFSEEPGEVKIYYNRDENPEFYFTWSFCI